MFVIKQLKHCDAEKEKECSDFGESCVSVRKITLDFWLCFNSFKQLKDAGEEIDLKAQVLIKLQKAFVAIKPSNVSHSIFN